MIDPKSTVAEIIRRYPQAQPVLARYGLDACCGGSHPLEFACKAHHVDVEEVVRAVEMVAAPAGDPAAGAPVIDASMTVRDVLERHPSTFAVFERHGLMGCGGMQGPVEPIGWFAQVHHVDLAVLLDELETAARNPAAAGAAPEISPAMLARENLYRRFLKAALLFTFTGGTAVGAWALIVMGMRGHLGGISRGLIQVHGHWQLFGWVGLFIVGVAYHILPRLTGVPLPSYRAAVASFVLLTAGAILRFGQALDPSALRTVLLLGGALFEIAGCGLFAWTLGRILRAQPMAVQPFQAFLAAGTAWFFVATLLNLGHAIYLVARATFEIPPFLNLPYLTIFLLGFVTFWILGVSLRTLPVFMGLRARPDAALSVALPLSGMLALMAAGEAAFVGGSDGLAVRLAFGVGGLGTAVCLGLFTWALGILARPASQPEPGVDRGYEKFLRLGYAWLLLSGAMLAVFSIFVIAGADLDHAYVGAYRHALTVGFITTIIVGMASRIIPVFRGVPLYSARMRDASFWLLLTGNIIRVLFQSLSATFGPAMLKVAAVSGVMELAGLVLFGINLWKTMDAPTVEDIVVKGYKPPIAAETKVADLLRAYPDLLPVFIRNGFAPLANPVLRRTLARMVSVGEACRMHGVDVQSLLGQLSEARARSRA